jgi:hypothetical protein
MHAPKLPYNERMDVLSKDRHAFFATIQRDVAGKFRKSSYKMDLVRFRDDCLDRSASARKAREEESVEQMQAQVREHERAMRHLKQDIVHGDEMINWAYPFLRMIPSVDRREKRPGDHIFI